MAAWYNENDPFAAEWLRCLIREGHIAPGEVDTRSIEDVTADDLRGFTQHHFFAGIGGWPLGLRLAGWPDERPIWTGSCPCQPFSAAGKGGGFADERHLWPAWHWLIGQCRPDIILGEQVASKAGLGWFDLVSADLEGEGYTCGAADLCAAGVGAPHIRQRLYWLADRNGRHPGAERQQRSGQHRQQPAHGGACVWSALADDDEGLEVEREQHARGKCPPAERGSEAEPLAHSDAAGCGEQRSAELLDGERPAQRHDADGCGEAGALQHAARDGWEQRRPEPGGRGTAGFWREADWIACRDGKWRPVEPGTFPLASGIPGRVGALRGYGNSINAPLAAEFIKAALA